MIYNYTGDDNMKETNDKEFNVKAEILEIIDTVKRLLDKEDYARLNDYIIAKEERVKANVYVDRAEKYVDKLIYDLK